MMQTTLALAMASLTANGILLDAETNPRTTHRITCWLYNGNDLLDKFVLPDDQPDVSYVLSESLTTPDKIGCQNQGDDWLTTEFLYQLKVTKPDSSRRSWLLNLNDEYSNQFILEADWAQPQTTFEINFIENGVDIAFAYKEADCDEGGQKLAFTTSWYGFKEGDQEGSLRVTSPLAPKSFKIIK